MRAGDDGGLGERSTLVAEHPLGRSSDEGAPHGKVLEVQRAEVLGVLFDRPTLRRFGRYVVLDVLGHGGMGVVLKGYDDELDRQVAIKVLHEEVGDQHAARLRREAQALAKLSHPNVVQVYEVGQLEGQSFVAMELVKGQTVLKWLRQEPRPDWRACVGVFIQLGQGLAAAHKRGLVHRDFKPGNAMIDEEGRACVLDFGLARQDQRSRAGEESEQDEHLKTSEQTHAPARITASLETSLTKTGTVLGTPAYMPLEQMDGLPTDGRGDQFSFCVALYEAVYGERPYEADSIVSLMVAMRAGTVRPAPKDGKVPVSLRRVLLRGLSVEPAERWPSMDALLEQLRRIANPRRRRRRMVLGGVVGLLMVGGGLSTTRALEWMNRCTGAREQLADVWDDVRGQAVKAAILGTGLSYAPGTWERMEPRLDEYADAWAAEHTEACEATRLRDEQTEEEMSLRMGCLHERRQYLRATVNELAHADATVVEHAVQAVASLPGLERCRDIEALRAEVPPPEDQEVAAKVAALDDRLVEAKAKQEAGKYEAGLRLVDEVVEQGMALEYEPLVARAWLRQGALRNEMGQYEGAVEVLRRAYGAAVAYSMVTEAAETSALMVYVLGYRLARPDEGRGWAEHAEAFARAAGKDEALARYLSNLGSVAHSQGEYEEARTLNERALAIKERALGPEHHSVANSLNNLGSVVYTQGKYEEARNLLERARAINEKTLGSGHPSVANSLSTLGAVAYEQGEYEEARKLQARALAIKEKALGSDHPSVAGSLVNAGLVAESLGEHEEARKLHERALAILEKALGPDHPDVARALGNMGNMAESLGEHEEARKLNERALAIWEKALGPDHPLVAGLLNNLGTVACSQGRYEEARKLHERALAIWEKALGPDHLDVADLLHNLGLVARLQGEYEEARTLYERALAIREKALGLDHADVADSLTWLGETRLALARPAEALAPLERALTIRTAHDVDPALLAQTRFALARALWSAPAAEGRDRLRARTLAEQARDIYAPLGDTKQPKLAEVDAWLAEHRLP